MSDPDDDIGIVYVLKLGSARFLSGALIAATFAYPVMLALGILHSYWRGVPAFGYLATVILLWAFRLVVPYAVKTRDFE